ncbi:MAG: molecular chaperone DnaJ [Rhodospirillaceae bacterium]|nr:molecular chaperone DnaJ [Rhodospirillaceae bacterium]|tara:strand:+ start:16016 stop:17173 length:1158 start_codon:yes stop_codon:yes gene_type:complete
MAKQDFYDVLGIAQNSSADEIKKAYRKKAMQYHPDRNQGDDAAEQKFKEVNEAYDILKDDQKRAAYDQFGHAAFDGNGGGGFGEGGFGGFGGGGFADIFDEMFGDFTGRQRSGGRSSRGGDLRYNMEISLDDAHRGRDTRIRVPTSVSCDSCGGSGAKKGTQPSTCGTCQGHGKVRASQGFFTIERTCPACQGEGRVIGSPCDDCNGSGAVRKEKTLEVTIPAGVEDGMRIRLSGEGEAGSRGSPPGDLYIFIAVGAHPLFRRDGADIFCTVPIPMTTAALGGSVEVPSIDGSRAKVTIPVGAQSGHRLRLRSKGMSGLHGKGRGDMYIDLQVETPVNLNKEQKEKLQAFQSTLKSSGKGSGKSTSPESEGFFAKAKELWDDLTD